MKKNFLSIVALALVLGLASCKSSSSFEGDVKKLANYQCKEKQLMAKDPADEKAKKELEELNKEMEEYRSKMEEKYKNNDDKEMNEKAKKIVSEIMDKCN